MVLTKFLKTHHRNYSAIIFLMMCQCDRPVPDSGGGPDLNDQSYAKAAIEFSLGNAGKVKNVLTSRQVDASDQLTIEWADRFARQGNAEGYYAGAMARENMATSKEMDDPERLLLLKDALDLYKEAGRRDPKAYAPTDSELNGIAEEMEKARQALRMKYGISE